MKTKLDYLRDIGLYDILSDDLVRKIKVEEYEKGDIMELEAFQSGKVWKILEGQAKMTIYMEHGGEYYGDFTTGEWMGVAACLIDLVGTVDIEAKKKTKVLVIPLKEMIRNHPEVMQHLWEKIATGSALEFVRVLGGTLAKAVLSNEGYFLKYLSQNNMRIKFTNTRELSELLNTNLRTLQRIIRKLREDGVIEKSRNEIWVVDEDKFEAALISQTEKF